MLAIIHLNCDAKQARLFRSARTGKQASGILSRRYASSSTPNDMRLEVCFGTARQVASQSMTDWIAYMENPSKELIAVGVDVTGECLASRILGGLASDHDSVKQALRARDGGPSPAHMLSKLLLLPRRKISNILAYSLLSNIPCLVLTAGLSMFHIRGVFPTISCYVQTLPTQSSGLLRFRLKPYWLTSQLSVTLWNMSKVPSTSIYPTEYH